MRQFRFAALLLTLSLLPSPSIAEPIRSFSHMPCDAQTLLSLGDSIDDPFRPFSDFLVANAISTYTPIYGSGPNWQWEPGSGMASIGWINADTTSADFPHGRMWYGTARKLIFSTPVYAVGATF